jgi:hypothetical protein
MEPQSSKRRTGAVPDVQNTHYASPFIDRVDDSVHVRLLLKQEMA